MSAEPAYTPAAGHHWLTPFYDLGVAALTREKQWRGALVEQLDPNMNDTIVDIGCGTGSLLLRLGRAAPSAKLIGIDPDPAIMAAHGRDSQLRGSRSNCTLVSRGKWPSS